MTPHLWKLDALDTTLLLLATGTDDIPAIIWFGESLPDDIDSKTVHAITDIPAPMAKIDVPVPLCLFPERSSGIDCAPALRGHRDGKMFDHRFKRVAVNVRSNGLTVELIDQTAALAVTLALTLHESTGVLSIATTLQNQSSEPYTVDWLASATLPMPACYRECMHIHGRWGLEFQTQRSDISTGALMLSSHRGRTSHERYPGVVLGEAGFSEQRGDVMAAKLAWSGSHSTGIELLSDGRVVYQSGVSFDPGEIQLAANESFSAPACHFKRDAGSGLNAISQSLHAFMRQQALPAWTRTTRPVHANSWEALYFNHDIDTLKSLIDAAATVGAERFILDDGWFPARRSDHAGLGDWIVDTSIYPDGLHPVVEHVRSNGMQFGLWFEPEMVNPDSEIYRQHPDWTLHLESYETPLARNQLVLNIDKPEVFEYLFQCISTLVEEYKIDYIKWDHNRDIILAGDGSKSKMAKQTLACYRLMDKLTTEHKALEIESCSSGGARADWGVLKYTGRVWTSDSIDAIDRISIQRGYSYFNPPEIMGAHVGHAEAHLTGRYINIHTRAIVALQGQFGYEIDARVLNDTEIKTLNHYVGLYKKHRDWIAQSTTWRLDSSIEHLVCSGLVSADQKTSLWFATVVSSMAVTVPGTIVLCGLKPDGHYTVSLASDNFEQLAAFTKKSPAWLSGAITSSGKLLMTLGLTLPVMPAQSALLLEVTAV